MTTYLDRFNRKLRKGWKGSLVKVEHVKVIEPNAKEYLNKLAKAGTIDRVIWGWYWVPDDYSDFYDFMRKDKNFKVLSSQSAASFWNHDFIHRDVYSIKVADMSYKKALECFANERGWDVEVELLTDVSTLEYVKRGGIFVETFEDTIISCLHRWAFTDAFSVLYYYNDRIKFREFLRRAYWKRVARSDVRIKQALEYGAQKFNELLNRPIFKTRKTVITDELIRNNINEAVAKVVEFA